MSRLSVADFSRLFQSELGQNRSNELEEDARCGNSGYDGRSDFGTGGSEVRELLFNGEGEADRHTGLGENTEAKVLAKYFLRPTDCGADCSTGNKPASTSHHVDEPEEAEAGQGGYVQVATGEHKEEDE